MGREELRRIGCSAWWPIPTEKDRHTQAQPADSEGAQPAAPGPLGIPIGCRISHGSRYYADQPIPWPNSSYPEVMRGQG
jgi:hypothetical protein